jgi:uncharacterized protein (UPF0333 family)
MATLTEGKTSSRAVQAHHKKATVKMFFWLLVTAGLIFYMVFSYTSGQMVRWYYYTASADGYAIDANTFANATPKNPAQLTIVTANEIKGLQAVPVRKGERLPEKTNGVITSADLKSGKRVSMDAATNSIRVMVPAQIKESKGFKYKDTFKHKGVRTNPWSAVWNVGMVVLLGLALGMFAEGVTDFMGMKIEKIDHAIAH